MKDRELAEGGPPSKKHLRLSVRALVEQTLRTGDLLSEIWRPRRPLEGIRTHQWIQRTRPGEYAREVPVSHRVETEEFILDVGGRIDGVYRYPERVIVEEIKTTSRPLEDPGDLEHPLHWAQLKAYAYIYARKNGLDAVEIQLTYGHIESGETAQVRRLATAAELEEFFHNIVARYLQWMRLVESHRSERDASIRSARFPFPAYRPGQRSIAVDVYRALGDGSELLVEAPTGIGKTMAVLYPTLKAMAEGHAEGFFYVTPRTTGKALAEEALDVLRHRGVRVKTVTLTAKEKICFNPRLSCNSEECEFAQGYFDRIGPALEETFQRDRIDREAVEETARRHHVCPFEFSLGLALWADGVIGDYNYAFDPAVALRRFFDESRRRYAVLVDEAHNLVDRARDMFSAEVRRSLFLRMACLVGHEQPDVARASRRIGAWLLSEAKKRGQTASWEKDPPQRLYPRMRDFLGATERWLGASAGSLHETDLELYFAVSRFLRVAERYDQSYVTCYERTGSDVRLKLFCVDPSSQLHDTLEKARAAVFVSATLSPLDYFRRILGCREDAKVVSLPSPFPEDHLCLIVSDKASTLYRERRRTSSRVSRLLAALVSSRPGNYLLYFPSYEYLNLILPLFASLCPGARTLVQTPEMTEAERGAFLQAFRSDDADTLVGFAVMGGVFGEGIDLVGERLSGAAIVGVGLPAVGPDREIIREHFSSERMGFEFAYLYPGINRVLQAAGRVIRSETDRGAVLLIDERFSHTRYRSLLPRHWRPLRLRDERAIGRVLQDFWGRRNARSTTSHPRC